MVMVHQEPHLHQHQQEYKASRVFKYDSGQHGRFLRRGRQAIGDEVWLPQTGLRVKRPPVLGGRRIIGGPSTPVPRWKLYENPFYDGIAAAAAAAAQQQHNNTHGGRTVAVSARKLAATLWELQEFPFPMTGAVAATAATASRNSACPCVQQRPCASLFAETATTKARSDLLALADGTRSNGQSLAPEPHPLLQRTSPPHTSFLQGDDAPMAKESAVSFLHPNKGWENGERKSHSQPTSSRQVAAMRSHVHRLLERRANARINGQVSTQPSTGSYNTVLNQIQDNQEQHPSAALYSMITTLRVDLESARTRAHELELAHKSVRKEMESLLKKVTEEKLSWQIKEQEKIRFAMQSVKMETEDEKRARRKMESLNRKMSKELNDANIAVAKAVQELERERKARELMEDVCDELAREIGEDKAEVEELKRESAKVIEEVEEERQMLQMAEVWREERVQMKLAEARFHMEEKHAILEGLKSELEAFLRSRKAFLDDPVAESSSRIAIQEAEELKTAMDSLQLGGDFIQASSASSGSLEEVPGLGPADWNIEASQSRATGVHVESESRLENREEILERLRRKYDQHSRRLSSMRRGQEPDSSEKAEDERVGDGSEWNSQSEQQDEAEEEGSQWESASDQEILEALELNISAQSPHGEVMPVSRQYHNGPSQIDDASNESSSSLVGDGGDNRLSPPQANSVKSSVHRPPGDGLGKGGSPSVGRAVSNDEQQQRRLPTEGTRSFLGRGLADLSRSAHMRWGTTTDQGIASPSRNWRSPDRGNPHIARGIRGFIEWPKISRENGVKNKLSDPVVERADRRILKQNL